MITDQYFGYLLRSQIGKGKAYVEEQIVDVSFSLKFLKL